MKEEIEKLKEEIEDMKKMINFFKEKWYKDWINYNDTITEYYSKITENRLKIIELYMSKILLD